MAKVKLPETDKPQVLCVDIGATDVKIELWSLNLNGKKLERKTAEYKYRTAPQGNELYIDGEAFALRLLEQIKENSAFKEELNSLVCIGIGWPGAIEGKPGAEHVAGPSGILNYFRDNTGQILPNTTKQIHNLRIRESFEKVFSQLAGHTVLVRLINDGEAHIRAASQQFKGVAKDCKVMLVAGTGTALALIPSGDSTPAPILAEVGKFILNLLAPFPTEKENFPKGVANKIFSKATNTTLAREILEKTSPIKLNGGKEWPDEKKSLSWLYPREIGYFLSSIYHESPDSNLLTDCLEEDIKYLFEQQQELRWLTGNLDQIRELRKKLLSKIFEDFPDFTQIAEPKAPIQALFPSPEHQERYKEFIKPDIDVNQFSNGANQELQKKIKMQRKQERFGLVIGYRAGCLLADLAAVCIDLFQANSLFCGGGPMSGETGKIIRIFARQELSEFYGFDMLPTTKYHLVRKLNFPSSTETNYSGGWGAGSVALDHYFDVLKESESEKLEDKLHCFTKGEKIKVGEDGIFKVGDPQPILDLKWNTVEEIVAHLDKCRAKLGIYLSDKSAGTYTYVFVDIPDPILRH